MKENFEHPVVDQALTELINDMGKEKKENHTAKGPRNTPKPGKRKKQRREQRAKRKANRGKYSGQ